MDALEIAQALAAALDEAWNNRDAAGMAALMAPEADFTFHNGVHIHGADAVERFWTDRVFPSTPPTLRHLGSVTEARLIADDVILGTGDFCIYDSSVASDPASGIPEKALAIQTKALGIAVQQEGVWRFSVIQLWVPQRPSES